MFITLTIGALSVFLVVIGSPYSYVSNCFSAGECQKLSRIVFIPIPQAVIPLMTGVVVALGLVTKRMVLAWSGTISLLLFSLLAGFSIGLFYLPFGIVLLGLIGAIQLKRYILNQNHGPTHK